MTRLWYAGLLVFLLTMLFTQRDFDDRYNRPIIGDAKGYYAYLPAIFIYQDLTYGFVDQMEITYYAEDGSLAKDFKVEQPNGTFVNKCFPGTAIFYLPFFLLAMLLSWFSGLPVDGYSILFQWSIVAAHFFYFFLGIFALDRFLRKRDIVPIARVVSILSVTLISNTYFYLIYDHSVAHIFGFFGFAVLLLIVDQWKSTQKFKYAGYALVILSLLVITRPTNAMMLLAFPLVFAPRNMLLHLKQDIRFKSLPWKQIIVALMILFIAPLLWKLQTDNWLVYSYGDEKLNLRNPNLLNFLFSYKKGWLLWSPGLLFATIAGFLYFFRTQKWTGVYYLISLFVITYVFSSWWIWTFGMGMGQRTMIDFYPLLIWGLAGFLSVYFRSIALVIAFTIPFAVLNMVQAHQFHRFILVGGETTASAYWQHFLQLKTNPPTVIISENWELIAREAISESIILDSQQHYSPAIELSNLPNDVFFVVTATIGGENRKSNATIVMSDANGYYASHFPSAYIYASPRAIQYLFQPEQEIAFPIKCYIWNSDTDDRVLVEELKIDVYRSK